MPKGKKLDAKKSRALTALLEAETHQEAAQQAGVSLRTLYNWLADPAFIAEYRRLRRQLVEGAVVKLQRSMELPVAKLVTNLECGKPEAENTAAVKIIDHALRGTETLDFAEELEQLKEAMKHVNRNPAPGADKPAPAPATNGRAGPGTAGPHPAGPGNDPGRGGDGAGPVAAGDTSLFR